MIHIQHPLHLTRLACMALALSAAPSFAATISKISPTSGRIIVELEPSEKDAMEEGDMVKLEVSGREEALEGKVQRIRGRFALVRVPETPAEFSKGGSVQLAAVGDAPIATKTEEALDTPTARAPSGAGVFTQRFANPAHLYRLETARTEAVAGVVSEDVAVDGNRGEIEASLRGPRLEAAAFQKFAQGRLTAGIGAGYEELSGERRLTAAETNQDESVKLLETHITPRASLGITETVTLGTALQVTQVRRSGEIYTKSHDLAFTRPSAGLLFHDEFREGGIVFRPKISEESEVQRAGGESETQRVRLPPEWTLHGRLALAGGWAGFARLTHNQYRVFNVDGEHTWNNNLGLTVGGERQLGEAIATGSLRFQSPAYDDEDEKTPDNIVRYGVVGSYLREIGGNSLVGGELSFLTGEETYDSDELGSTEVGRDTLRLAVTGNMRL